MQRYYYSDNIYDFLRKKEAEIFGEISKNNQFSSDEKQKNTWL